MALDIFSQFATDESIENNGTWRPIGGGAELLIARIGNRRYGKALTKEVERFRSVLDLADDAADEKSNEIMIGVIASTILLGWRTKNADGSYAPTVLFKKKPTEYSIENAKAMLALSEFRKLVVKLADEGDAYRLKEENEQGEA